MVWRKELEKKLSINRYLPGQSRGAFLAIKWTNAQEGDQELTKRHSATMIMGILNPPGLSIARRVPEQKRPHKDRQLHGPGVWAGVPQPVAFDLSHQPHLPPPLICQNPHLLNP